MDIEVTLKWILKWYWSDIEVDIEVILKWILKWHGSWHWSDILSFCYAKAHKVSEIAEHLGISDSTYLRKRVLGNLEENGYLEKSKVSRTTFYKTKADMVKLE